MGNLGWVPLAGNWDGTPGDGVGFYVPDTGQFFLKNAHTPGPADTSFVYGMGGQGWRPLVGSWVGSGGQGAAVVGDQLPVIGESEQVTGDASQVTGYRGQVTGREEPAAAPAASCVGWPSQVAMESVESPSPAAVAAATDQLDLAALVSQELGSSLAGDDPDLLFAGVGRLRARIAVTR